MSVLFNEGAYMNIFPLQVVLVLRLALYGRIPKAYDTLSSKILRVTKEEAKNIVRWLSIIHKTVAYLAPART